MTVGLVAHDSGGAEVVAWCAREDGFDYLWAADGPAHSVFARLLDRNREVPLPQLQARSDRLLVGTSENSDFEWQAIREARRVGTPTAVFLEHWSNYRLRLLRHGELVLPNVFFVGDMRAESLARLHFPGTRVLRRSNPYLSAMVRNIKQIADTGHLATSNRVLYVSTPIVRAPFDEHDALRFFLCNISALGLDMSTASVVVRPHPSESVEKYLWVKRVSDLVVVRKESDLSGEIAEAEVVVGVSTMAMVVALMAGRRVVSAVPEVNAEHRLPFPEIEFLHQMIGPSTCSLQAPPTGARLGLGTLPLHKMSVDK